jgi:hypothetical protein
MSGIIELWEKSREIFENKTLAQILSFIGDGKLKDYNSTSKEYRELLDQVPFRLLQKFADNCLTDKFEDSGFALQDIINQIGIRLGFSVEHGLYRGKQNEIGFDGIWKSKDGHSIIVEVKTTDAYRINLDSIAEYRTKLIEQERINNTQSSILIVVGRQDTGDLEAQIRGSKHAWDLRLLSTDSLLNLLNLKETLNDTKTIQQINELLKPKEYTRIDKLIELIFLTSKDIKLNEPEEEAEEFFEVKSNKSGEPRLSPVNFHVECLTKIQHKLKIEFIKQTRIAYADKVKSIGLICIISKVHKQGKFDKYWFAFHPHQKDFLKEYSTAYVSFGCGSASNIFLIPFIEFEPLLKNMWTTEKEDRMYWHVVIHQRGDKFLLAQPGNKNEDLLDITGYKL